MSDIVDFESLRYNMIRDAYWTQANLSDSAIVGAVNLQGALIDHSRGVFYNEQKREDPNGHAVPVLIAIRPQQRMIIEISDSENLIPVDVKEEIGAGAFGYTLNGYFSDTLSKIALPRATGGPPTPWFGRQIKDLLHKACEQGYAFSLEIYRSHQASGRSVPIAGMAGVFAGSRSVFCYGLHGNADIHSSIALAVGLKKFEEQGIRFLDTGTPDREAFRFRGRLRNTPEIYPNNDDRDLAIADAAHNGLAFANRSDILPVKPLFPQYTR